jgi:hypothetical protein
MKRVYLLGFVISLYLTTANAQEIVSSYHLEHYTEGELSVLASEPKENGSFSYYIDVPPRRDSRQVALIVKDKNLEDFKNNIIKAKEVFLDWKQTAIDNDVNELNKEIELDKMSIGAAFVFGSWNFDFDIKLESWFKIVNGKHMLVFKNKYKLQSSSNRFIDSDGFVLTFVSEEEIDEFLQSLNNETVINYFSNKKSKEDIFTQN